ncbi:MAG: EVE domain-containing protein [Euryarchaeota archaeon]|nr:EVE domain-containing protein [Euryarchaeota archaeon]
MARRYWLMKSEPGTYSIEDLEEDGETHWDGVRNYQARNLMRDDMQVGDGVLFYHSNADPPGVAGVAKVVSKPYPDPTQFDPKSKYHDPKADPAEPRWWLVDIAFEERFGNVVALPELKDDTRFDDMMVTQRGSRLSVQPVAKKHFDAVVKLGRKRR